MKLIQKLLCILFALLMLGAAIPSRAFALSTSAQAAVLLEAGHNRLLYAQNESQRLPMASTTKIMTALVALEQAPLSRSVVISRRAAEAEGSSMELLEGELFTLEELLYGLLLVSGNDAAVAVAELVADDVEDFVALMNQKAQQLGLTDTHFDNPSGLDGDSHYTTAHELALIMSHALRNQDFCRIAGTRSKVIFADQTRAAKYLTNKHRLLKTYEGAFGGKTGYTKASGRSLVTAAARDGVTLIAVTINDPDDWRDHTALLDQGFSRTQYIDLSELTAREYSIPVAGGGSLRVGAEACAGVVLIDPEQHPLRTEVCLPRFVYAGIGRLQQVGVINLYAGEQLLERIPLRAQQSIPEQRERGGLFSLIWRLISGKM